MMKIKKEQVMKHKMSPDELQIHQHVMKKGGVTFKSKKDYRRKEKHPKRYI